MISITSLWLVKGISRIERSTQVIYPVALIVRLVIILETMLRITRMFNGSKRYAHIICDLLTVQDYVESHLLKGDLSNRHYFDRCMIVGNYQYI